MDNLKSDATVLNDIRLLQEIEIVMSIRKSILYHLPCRKEYASKRRSQDNQKKETTDWKKNRDIHSNALDHVCGYITENIVVGKKAVYFNLINDIYKCCIKGVFWFRKSIF